MQTNCNPPCVFLTWMCPLSSGFHLGLSGLPQQSGLRMDSSPPSQQEGLISRRGHSDASAEVTEKEKLPNSPHCRLRKSGSRDKLKTGRCFLSSAAKSREESLNFHFQQEGKTPRSCLCRGRRHHLWSWTTEARKKGRGGFTEGKSDEENRTWKGRGCIDSLIFTVYMKPRVPP